MQFNILNRRLSLHSTVRPLMELLLAHADVTQPISVAYIAVVVSFNRADLTCNWEFSIMLRIVTTLVTPVCTWSPDDQYNNSTATGRPNVNCCHVMFLPVGLPICMSGNTTSLVPSHS